MCPSDPSSNTTRTLDIVERLRDPKYECSWEAADEIERLRAALRAVREWYDNEFAPAYDVDWAALESILDRALGE